MKYFAKLVNVYAHLFPLSAGGIRWIENRLWKDPFQIKYFLTAIEPDILWKSAEIKLLDLVENYVKRTPALQQIKERYFQDKVFRSVDDFKNYFPILDKENYVKPHTITEISMDGKLPRTGSFYTSAGTTGKPTVWIESSAEEMLFDKMIAYIADLMLDIRKKDYIILNCWALGSWPTGIDFFVGIRHHAKVANVGTNIPAAIEVLKVMGPEHPYVIAGYPPSVFHLLEACGREGVDLSQYKIDVVTGGEGFVEEWRDVVIKKLGPERTIFSVYGSTDKGLGEGLETNFAYVLRSLLYIASTFLRDEAEGNEPEARAIMQSRFGIGELPFTGRSQAKEFLLQFLKEDELKRLPMVFQFNPLDSYNENLTMLDPGQGRQVREFLSTVLSPITPIPRVRYNIHDEGFVMTYSQVAEILAKYGIDVQKLNPRHDPNLDLRLPFLFLFGRSDGTVSVDGANIFTEDIGRCLYANEGLARQTHGFQLFVSDDYHFSIAIELSAHAEASDDLRQEFRSYFAQTLSRYSLGYQEIQKEGLPSADIEIELHPQGTGPFSVQSIKTHYVRHRSLPAPAAH